MSTAVLDLELNLRPPGPISAPGYPRALILLRWRGRPVGQLTLPVRDGVIDEQRLETALSSWADWAFWSVWVHDSVGWDEAEPSGPPPSATIAICTRERPEDLRRCLNAVMALPDDGQEVTVVDNRPLTEETARVVRSFPAVRYVRQDDGGLNAARNRAVREARHSVVAFTDDDAVVDSGWLRSLLRNFSDPRVLCTTGLTMPAELETEAQELFEAYSPFGRGFHRRTFHVPLVSPLATGPIGAGANMAIRKTLFQRLGTFDEALDAGTPTLSGGDHEMFSRILAAGFRIVYDPAALSWHRHRRTMRELHETLRGYGTGVYAMWTRALLKDREYGVFKQALAWLLQGQLPELRRSLNRRRRRVPVRLLAAEWQGCLAGPLAYMASLKALRRTTPEAGANVFGPR